MKGLSFVETVDFFAICHVRRDGKTLPVRVHRSIFKHRMGKARDFQNNSELGTE